MWKKLSFTNYCIKTQYYLWLVRLYQGETGIGSSIVIGHTLAKFSSLARYVLHVENDG